MTYKELEQKLKELDEDLVLNRKGDWIGVRCAGKLIMSIDDRYPYEMDTILFGFDKILENKPYAEELFNLCVELAKTPIDERVEPQKYHVEFTDGFMLSRGWEGKLEDIKIDRPSDIFLEDGGRVYYTFTEAEIKQIDERYWAFAVPVEANNGLKDICDR